MKLMYNVGCLDGKSLIDMNNLAVGYFPGESLEIAVYPAPVPQAPHELTVQQANTTVEQPGQTNS
jgi:hypothetical protein